MTIQTVFVPGFDQYAVLSCSPHSHFLQLIASEQKNIDFLLSLCDFAILRGFPQLRDTVRNLLKLLPTGQLHSNQHTHTGILCCISCLHVLLYENTCTGTSNQFMMGPRYLHVCTCFFQKCAECMHHGSPLF